MIFEKRACNLILSKEIIGDNMKMRNIYVFICLFTLFYSINVYAYADSVIRVGILRFISMSDGISDRQAEAITDEFTNILVHSNSIAVIERSQLDAREHRMNLSGMIDVNTAVQVGKAAGLQYIIAGSITRFFQLSNQEAEVTISTRMINVQTAEIILSISEIATASNVNIAIFNAINRLAYKMQESISGEHPNVLKVESEKVFISVGASLGVKQGDLYKVYDEKEEFDAMGRSLGKNIEPRAVVSISKVNNNFSIAQVVKGNVAHVQFENKVEPISQIEASRLPIETGLIKIAAVSQVPQQESAPNTNTPQPKTTAVKNGFENHSDKAKKVIPSYGLDANQTNHLLKRHAEIEKMLSKKEMIEKYQNLFRDFSNIDYFAAYKAAKLSFEIGKNAQALTWAEKSLSLNPGYAPAMKVLQAAKNKMK